MDKSLNGKKVPIIPPFFINNKFVTEFQEKLMFLTHRFQAIANRIKTIYFAKSDVKKLIKASDVSKTYGHDGISVKMIKICADSIAHPLTL